MTYAELIAAVSRASCLSLAQSEAALEGLRRQMVATLAAGGEIKLPGVGSFAVVATAARSVPSPSGNRTEVPAGRRVRFRPAKALRERLAGVFDGAVDA
ncbi:putative DNA-binding protein HU 1 [Candidatus Defluviicoccus seviourii]|uniref:DNA-binding protein HU 1 n=1 Tax=Candidatus Defluviicoccus seviourii TaxID=2565273 RepID=A0A564WIS3_9PROT|nr:putative DNA-binding protein HU 1 [Candidatus Defluviicoccus seviourii]